jgi:hypothetical protein
MTNESLPHIHISNDQEAQMAEELVFLPSLKGKLFKLILN